MAGSMRRKALERADFLPWSNVLGPSVEVKGRRRPADALLMDIRLSEVISALSYALDVTEGQPMGHAVRSCAIGMRIGEEIGLAPEERSSLFYALLLKDAGCSSNAARLSSLFGADDLEVKRTRKLIDHHRPGASLRHVHPPRPHPPARRDRPQRRRGRARDDRAALRARRRHRAHDRAVGDDRGGDPQPRRALGRRRLPLRPRRRRDPAVRPHPLPGPDRRGVLRRRRPARGARRRGRAPRHLVRPRARRRAALDAPRHATSGRRSAASSRTA